LPLHRRRSRQRNGKKSLKNIEERGATVAKRARWIGNVGVIVVLALFILVPIAGAAPAADEADSIDADDQSLVNGTVTVGEVNASQDGWMVIHIDEGGKPGKVIGHTAVKKGDNYGVGVKLSEAVPVGGKLWPMLHVDAGKIGTYEFPGADAPVILDGNIVMKQITVIAASAGASSADNAVEVSDQPLNNGSITTSNTIAAKDGWLAIHVDEGGSPGKVIGFSAVKTGSNKNIVTKLSEAVPVGGKLWPMLHLDAGKIGTYEFPGPDSPVIVNGGVVMKQITITATTSGPASLPTTGETNRDVSLLLVFFGLALLSLGALVRQQR